MGAKGSPRPRLAAALFALAAAALPACADDEQAAEPDVGAGRGGLTPAEGGRPEPDAVEPADAVESADALDAHDASDPCPIPHTVDGAFTGFPEVTACAEWGGPPAKGVFGDLWVDTDGGALVLLNDWHLNTSGPILPGQFNQFFLGIAGGGPPIEVRVFSDAPAVVLVPPELRTGSEYEVEGAAGFGPSPSYADPHTIFEFRITGLGWPAIFVKEADPGGTVWGGSVDSNGNVSEPTTFSVSIDEDGGATVATIDVPTLLWLEPGTAAPGVAVVVHGALLGTEPGVVHVGDDVVPLLAWGDEAVSFEMPVFAGTRPVSLVLAGGVETNSLALTSSCQADCSAAECGSDGCGGSCGDCNADEECVSGTCACAPACPGPPCVSDGCGGVCQGCPGGEVCHAGACCEPDCADKECGVDGCGGSCGSCPGAVCVAGSCCTPQCDGKSCGPDGCGGVCGSCPPPKECQPDATCQCFPDCKGKLCGDDGCGGSCGSCPGAVCVAGACCAPQCDGKSCGPDGCGGVCGTCGSPEKCQPDGSCQCFPDCSGKLCGDDGCGDSCGTCSPGLECKEGKCL